MSAGMGITDADIREALHRATADLATGADLLDRVSRGGRRRLVRRRTILGVSAAAVVAVAFGGTVAGRPDRRRSVLTGPTRGDLAADEAYLDRVRDLWTRHLDRTGRPDPSGESTVVWAGRTPAGPAAILARPVDDRGRTILGFVEEGPDGPRVLTTQTVDADLRAAPLGMLLGTDRDVLVVLDTGDRVDLSPDFRYESDGRIGRTFTPLAFANGAAITRVGRQVGRPVLALFRPPHGPTDGVGIANSYEVLAAGGRLGEQTPDPLVVRLPGADRYWPVPVEDMAVAMHEDYPVMVPYLDRWVSHRTGPVRGMVVVGLAPEDRPLWMSTIQYDDDPARAFLVVRRPSGPATVTYGGFVAPDAPVPVRFRVPDGQGWLVAGDGVRFRWRTGASAPWQEGGEHAALLPPAAVDVEATRPGRTPVAVPL